MPDVWHEDYGKHEADPPAAAVEPALEEIQGIGGVRLHGTPTASVTAARLTGNYI
jgi:hypothetical protein